MKKIFLVFMAFATALLIGFFSLSPSKTVKAEEQSVASVEEIISQTENEGNGDISSVVSSVDETPDESENGSNSQDLEESSETAEDSALVSDNLPETSEKGDVTIDDVLDFAGEVADDAGIGDKWREVVNNLKNAITQEQFTVSTLVDVLLLLVMIGYIIYKVIVNKKIVEISKYLATLNKTETANGATLTTQTNALREMASEEEKVLEISETVEKNQEYLAISQEHTNNALLHIVEGINFTPERKAAAIRALNKSNEALDKRTKGGGKNGNN